MEAVSDNVTSNVSNTAKGLFSDITLLQFYKNPVFIGFCIYITLIVAVYSSMNEITKVDYVFSNKFRNDGDVLWSDILYYPYDPSSSTASLIKVLVTPPIMWFIVIYTLFFTTIIDTTKDSRQTYFYAIMAGWLVILLLISVHVIIFNFVIKPDNVTIELPLDSGPNKNTYIEFYRTQWLLLFVLSPIYVIIVLYIARKLGK